MAFVASAPTLARPGYRPASASRSAAVATTTTTSNGDSGLRSRRPLQLGKRRARFPLALRASSSAPNSPPAAAGGGGGGRARNDTDAFLEWLSDNGVYLSDKSTWGRPPHPLRTAEDTTDEGEPSGRGLVARSPIQAGATLFEIPFHLCMTRRVAERRFAALGVPHVAAEDDYIALATLLVYEARVAGDAASFWAPYLRMLPHSERDGLNLLFMWSDDDLRMMEGSPTLAAALSLRHKLAREYEGVRERLYARHPRVFPEPAFTYDAFLWAFAVLFSRAVLMPSDGDVLALVPYADLLNHSPFSTAYIDSRRRADAVPAARWPRSTQHDGAAGADRRRGRRQRRRPRGGLLSGLFGRSGGGGHDDDEGDANDLPRYLEDTPREIVVYSDRSYAPSEQVFATYGQKSNSELLLLYGFTSERNPFNAVELNVSLASSAAATTTATTATANSASSLYARKRAYLEACDRDPDAPTRFPLHADRYPMELKEFVRFAALDEEDIPPSPPPPPPNARQPPPQPRRRRRGSQAGVDARNDDANIAAFDALDLGNPISEVNEAASALAIASACKAALARYPTDADEDAAVLSDREMARLLGRNQRLALRMRRGEKRILQRTVASVEREVQQAVGTHRDDGAKGEAATAATEAEAGRSLRR